MPGGRSGPSRWTWCPRIITADEWDVIESGVAQRVKALEAFLADVYGREGSSLPPRVVEAGLLPARIIRNSPPHFHRAVAGIHPHNEVRCHVSGIDLIRDAEGVFRVLEDNVRVPRGGSPT